eukprot:SAG22_NODE_10912_length_510_cov_0.851582_1_plen_120_part_00
MSELVTGGTPVPYDDIKAIVVGVAGLQAASWKHPLLDDPVLSPQGEGKIHWPFAFAHDGTPGALTFKADDMSIDIEASPYLQVFRDTLKEEHIGEFRALDLRCIRRCSSSSRIHSSQIE